MKSLTSILAEKKISILDKNTVIPLSDVNTKVAQTAIKTGLDDGEKPADSAPYKKVSIAVKKLQAAQTEIIPEKAIGMAIGMMLGEKTKIGGDLGSIISADNYIMDGHHRWAATYLCDPNASVEGTQIGLDGIPLVSTLNIITKGVHNRSGNEGKGNIKDFTGSVIGKILDDYIENGISGQFPISSDEVKERLSRVPGANGDFDKGKKLMMKNADALPKSIMPGAPARVDMPVINPEEVKAAAEMIKQGQIDLTEPFSEKTTKAMKECFSDETVAMLQEHYISALEEAGVKLSNESVYESFVDENLITEASDKDWGRMLDLVIADKNGANVAKSIKDKSKAIARYVAGVKLCGYDESKILNAYSKTSNQFYKDDYYKFNAFGTKALELGATIEEIIDEFNATEIPQKWKDKHQDMISKNLSNWVTGPLMRKILKAGYDFEQIGRGGHATTWVGQDAMQRSGLKWTLGYKYNLLINDQKYLLAFDAITSEAVDNNTVYFVVDSSVSDKVFRDITPISSSVNLTKFYNNIINACKNIEQTNESVKFTIQPLQNGITTDITVHDDGVSILQKQGSSKNDIFLSFDQLDELMKQLKHK